MTEGFNKDKPRDAQQVQGVQITLKVDAQQVQGVQMRLKIDAQQVQGVQPVPLAFGVKTISWVMNCANCMSICECLGSLLLPVSVECTRFETSRGGGSGRSLAPIERGLLKSANKLNCLKSSACSSTVIVCGVFEAQTGVDLTLQRAEGVRDARLAQIVAPAGVEAEPRRRIAGWPVGALGTRQAEVAVAARLVLNSLLLSNLS